MLRLASYDCNICKLLPLQFTTTRSRIGTGRPSSRLFRHRCIIRASLTPPLQTELTDVLTGYETLPAPLWGTWCGVSNGLWVGVMSAYAPYTGEAEPIALDGKTKLYEVNSVCVEERVVDDEGDRIVRHTASAASDAQLTEEMLKGGNLQFDPTLSVDFEWDSEVLPRGDPGLYFFDGGSYSAGPAALGAAAGAYDDYSDEEEEEEDDEGAEPSAAAAAAGDGSIVDLIPATDDEKLYADEDEASGALSGTKRVTSVMETCLQYGGEQRIRIKLTVATSGGGDTGDEVDVDLLRVSVYREAWEGLPGTWSAGKQPEDEKQAQQASGSVRLDPKDLKGFWNSFEVSSIMVEDISMETGKPAPMLVYTSQETQRLVLGTFPIEDTHGPEGGVLWLPHSCAVQLQLKHPQGSTSSSSAGSDSESESGNSNGKHSKASKKGKPPAPPQEPREFELTCYWQPRPGLVLGMSRRYNGDGTMNEVVCSSAIRAT